MASLYSDLLYFSCLISWEHYKVRVPGAQDPHEKFVIYRLSEEIAMERNERSTVLVAKKDE
jgi:hypothetical protein